ncbi:hypothetical protein [Mobiluncus mulieris]|uniref:hypothetical protein n=1 Tax=Mobiluncus mulieris TaxID=2052 RepID=UPI00146FF0F1|nr:hypothetical protein [Mobiluncus mulieris]NMX10896.1 hypothetical protein [Mobiluncus mulieris]
MNVTDVGASGAHDFNYAVGASKRVTLGSMPVSNQRLFAILGDQIEVSPQAELVSRAFSGLSGLGEVLRTSGDTARDLQSFYRERRDFILEACANNETYAANKDKLLDALNAEMRHQFSVFADDCVSVIGRVASRVSANDANLVRSGWALGYEGSEGLSLRGTEGEDIKNDIVNFFSAAIQDPDKPTASGSAPSGKILSGTDLGGVSFYRKLQGFASAVCGKLTTQRNMWENEYWHRYHQAGNDRKAAALGDSQAWSRNRLDIKAFFSDRQRDIANLEDTTALEFFSDGLKSILGRFDTAASVYNQFCDVDPTERVDEKSLLKIIQGLDQQTRDAGLLAFEQYSKRISRMAENLSDSQKLILGVMYRDAETLGHDKAFQKVDAFAGAMTSKNFHGFKFQDLGGDKKLNLINMVRWYRDDQDSTGVAKADFPKSVNVETRKIQILQKYLPHMQPLGSDDPEGWGARLQESRIKSLLEPGRTDTHYTLPVWQLPQPTSPWSPRRPD